MCTITYLGAMSADVTTDSRSMLGRYIGSVSAHMMALCYSLAMSGDSLPLLDRYVGQTGTAVNR